MAATKGAVKASAKPPAPAPAKAKPPAKAKARPKAKAKASPLVSTLHSIKVGETLEQNIEGHAARTDSKEFRAARATVQKIIATLKPNPYGDGPIQAHHGGSLWLYDGKDWRMVANWAGIEWSVQFCLTEEARVLTDDLRWTAIGNLLPDDGLLAFDEQPAPNRCRFWRPAKVLSMQPVMRPCYRLEFDDGTVVTSSAEHQWLASYGSLDLTRPRRTARWVETARLSDDQRRGASRVVKPLEVWDHSDSRGLGYLAAAFDGEGHLTQLKQPPRSGAKGVGHVLRAEYSQNPNAMWDAVTGYLKEYGFRFTETEGAGSVRQVHICERAEVLRLLGQARPQRLLHMFDPTQLGQMQAQTYATLVSKTYVGEQWVVALTTDTHTYIAEGLASHNCCDPARVDALRQTAKVITDSFPQTIPELQKLGYNDIDILTTPITDQASIARYVDSIWNACVPIPQPGHTGSVGSKSPLAAGVHNYPETMCAIPRVMRPDFIPFHIDSATKTAAVVVPVAPRGSGDGRVRVVFAEKGNPLAAKKAAAKKAGKALVLSAEHPLSRKAFANQT